MNILVTAGNTLALIDRVRCITNIFSGRTGAAIALQAHQRGHAVTLLTSHPEAVNDLLDGAPVPGQRLNVYRYRTFEDLYDEMARRLQGGQGVDAVVHSAAVSDYLAGGVFAPAPGTEFSPEEGHWRSNDPGGPTLVDRQAGKVKSDEKELWVRLVRAPKIVDQIRQPWGYRGLLVKFKLEVGVSDEGLLEVAEKSRAHSGADFMVANTLETAARYAFVGGGEGSYVRVSRRDLAERLLVTLEELHTRRRGEQGHG